MADSSSSSLSLTFGSVLVGVFVNIYLCAVTNNLCSWCFKRRRGQVLVQVALALAAVISTLQTALLCHSMYKHLISNVDLAVSAYEARWDWLGHLSIFAALSLVAQIYYVLRITHVFSGKRRVILAGSVALLTLAQFGLEVAALAFTGLVKDEQDVLQLGLGTLDGKLSLAAMCTSVANGFATSSAMLLHARTVPARFGERFSDKCMRIFFGSSLATTLLLIGDLVCFAALQTKGISVAFAIVVPKAYLLSMLASIKYNYVSQLPTTATACQSAQRDSDRHSYTLSFLCRGKAQSGLTRTKSRIGIPTLAPSAIRGYAPASPTWQQQMVELPRKISAHKSVAADTASVYSTGVELRSPTAISHVLPVTREPIDSEVEQVVFQGSSERGKYGWM